MSDTPPPPPGASPIEPVQSNKGLAGKLFDLSFTEFVTPSIIKFIYVIGIVLSAIVSIGVLAALASEGGGYIVLGLVLAPLIFFLYVLMARVMSEIYLILFRIEENTRQG